MTTATLRSEKDTVHFGSQKEIERYLERYFAASAPYLSAKGVLGIAATRFHDQTMDFTAVEGRLASIIPIVRARLHLHSGNNSLHQDLAQALRAYLEQRKTV